MTCFWPLVLSALTLTMFLQNPPPPIYLYASQSGRPTLDQGEGGGNPFASALVELLNRPALSFDAFRTELIDLTERKSRGFQRPEIQGPALIHKWQLSPKPENEKRIAVVLVFSDYSVSGAKSLPGAKHDAARVSEAFAKAGFKVQTLLDPDKAQMQAVSRELALQTATADVAVIYTTGHGVEAHGVTYVLPGDYPAAKGAELLRRRALPVHLLAAMLRARRANLVFYGGCRDNPL